MTDLLILDEKAEFYAAGIRAAHPGLSVVAATGPEGAQAGRDARALLALAPRIPADLPAAMPRLEWVQALTTGVDNLMAPNVLPGRVALTNLSGIHGPQMSELAFLLMLALARQFPRMLANQAAARWERWPQPLLSGRTLCVIGVGVIAEDLAARAAAFGLRVTGVSDGRPEVPGFAAIHPRARIGEAVAEAGFVVVLVPYSPATHHIVDRAVLGAMRRDAYLINIARGGCVDEAALLEALHSHRIAGAALDVFATEPLPQDSPFWTAPRCLVTPHIGGAADVYHEQALPVVLRNVALWVAGGIGALPGRIERDKA